MAEPEPKRPRVILKGKKSRLEKESTSCLQEATGNGAILKGKKSGLRGDSTSSLREASGTAGKKSGLRGDSPSSRREASGNAGATRHRGRRREETLQEASGNGEAPRHRGRLHEQSLQEASASGNGEAPRHRGRLHEQSPQEASGNGEAPRHRGRLHEQTKQEASGNEAVPPAVEVVDCSGSASPHTAPHVRARPEGVTVFDVGGHTFKVLTQLIRSRPGTLLATLQADSGGTSDPIFVDGAPSRFHFILDWYRYGEINLPESVPVATILWDARHFELPDEVVINGVLRSTHGNTALKVGRELVGSVVARWTGFKAFFERVLESIKEHYESVGAESARAKKEAEDAWDFPPYLLALYGEQGWVDSHLSSVARVRVLALKLEERGYNCEFSENELIVSLPLRLRIECAGAVSHHAEDSPEEEDAANGGVQGLEGQGH